MKATTIGIAFAAAGLTGAALQTAAASEGPAAYDAVIAKHSRATGVPEALIRRVIVRESKYNPRAMHRGHYGMMQIKPATAKSMGYRGSAAGLLDADVNLTYGVRYLAGAYRVAGGDHDRAVRYYASGYYYDAKRKGMLAQIGMGRNGALSAPPSAMAANIPAAAAPVPAMPQPVARTASVAQATPALSPQMAVAPMPPVRGAVPAGTPVVAAASVVAPTPQPRGPAFAAPQVVAVAAAAPLPPSRPADPRIVTPAAPQLAAAVPTPRSRALDPVVTGSIATPARPVVPTPPTRALASADPAQPAAASAAKPRIISPAAAPVFASAGPVAPATPQPAKPAAATMSFAAPDGAAKTPFPPKR